MKNKPEQWSSKFGFIMAAAGSAIGLGNIWKFPYIATNNGGAVFVIIYIVFLFLLGIPILMSEMAVGRYAGMNAVYSCRKIKKGWGFVGGAGVIGAFLIMGCYSIVGGWVLRYIFGSITRNSLNADFFPQYVEKPLEPIIWSVIFIFISALIVIKGISSGIERVSSVMLPILFVFLIGIMVYCLTLPNASEGIRYFFVPDFSKIGSFSDFGKIALNAMGQVFFSLSLGMGTLITYGSYLPKSSNITANAFAIVLLDTVIAIVAAITIIPAVFSYGLELQSGPGLLFRTLPEVFSRINGGNFLSALFFVLVLLAAITSAISLMEVIVSWLSASAGLSRRLSVTVTALAIALLACPASLSFGIFGDFKIAQMGFFDFLSFLSDKVIMPLGGFFICILVGYIWGIKPASEEISNGGKLPFRFKGFYSSAIRFFAPTLIIIIFISSFF